MKIFLIGLILSLNLLAPPVVNAEVGKNDKLIIVSRNLKLARVGLVKINTTEQDLIRALGKKKVKRECIENESCGVEIEPFPGEKLFVEWTHSYEPQDAEEKKIFFDYWKKNESQKLNSKSLKRIKVESVEIRTKGFRTPSGLGLGTNLVQLENINHAPISYEISESCFDGSIESFHGGRLNKAVGTNADGVRFSSGLGFSLSAPQSYYYATDDYSVYNSEARRDELLKKWQESPEKLSIVYSRKLSYKEKLSVGLKSFGYHFYLPNEGEYMPIWEVEKTTPAK